MQTKIRGVGQSGSEVDLKATDGGLLVNLPYQIYWTAKGYAFSAMATTAVAALVVRPTTTAAASLRNNSSNKVLVIERVFAHWLVSTAAQTYASVWVQVTAEGEAAITNDLTLRTSLNGGATGGSETFFEADDTVTDGGWYPWGTQVDTSATGVLPGAASIAEIGGRIIVPPTSIVSMHVISGLIGDTFCGGFHWFEVPESELLNS